MRRPIWTPDRWDDGYVDNRGRFRVYRPDYPRAYALGYALRAHVVWWLAKGRVHRRGTNLHHINEIKLDDRLENLAIINHAKHVSLHRRGPRVVCKCNACLKRFKETPNHVYNHGRGKYCSQRCLIDYRSRYGMDALKYVKAIVCE